MKQTSVGSDSRKLFRNLVDDDVDGDVRRRRERFVDELSTLEDVDRFDEEDVERRLLSVVQRVGVESVALEQLSSL